MCKAIISIALVILAFNLAVLVIAVYRSHTYEERLERDRKAVDRLTRRLKGPDL